MQEFLRKVTSRKFLVAVAAFLASIATTCGGFASQNDHIATVGIVCAALSAAIYAACEAYVDGQSVKSSVSTTTTTIAASSTSAEIVKKALSTTEQTAE